MELPASPNLFPENIPIELKELAHWILWVYAIQKTKTGKENLTKVPKSWNCKPTGTNLKFKQTWATFDAAYQAWQTLQGQIITWKVWSKKEKKYFDWEGRVAGIGFIFTETDYLGVDFDHAFHDGEWNMFVLDSAEMLGSYTEISPSGSGLHVILKGKKTETQIDCKLDGVEIYDADSPRYFTFTGNLLEGRAIPIGPADTLQVIYDRHPRPEVQPIEFETDQITAFEKLAPAWKGDEISLESPVTPSERTSMRLGFQAIWDGRFQVGKVPKEIEFLYWVSFYREAFSLGYTEKETFAQLAKTQTEFNEDTASYQLDKQFQRNPTQFQFRPSTHLYEKLFPQFKKEESPEQEETQPQPKQKPRREVTFDEMTDHQVLQRLFNGKQGTKARTLFNGDITGYNTRLGAILALCGRIAYYTKDVAQIERIFRISRLAGEDWPIHRAWVMAKIIGEDGSAAVNDG
jgi:hypothetical protein